MYYICIEESESEPIIFQYKCTLGNPEGDEAREKSSWLRIGFDRKKKKK